MVLLSLHHSVSGRTRDTSATDLINVFSTPPNTKMTETIDAGEFRRRCDNVNGVVQFAEDGRLLTCVAPVNVYPPPPLTVYFDEYTSLVGEEAAENLSIEDTEQNRLAVYFSIVYNGTPYRQWSLLSFLELRELYLSLDMYYLFPDDIMPRTPIPRNRPTGEASFYRVPVDVAMRQKYLYDMSDAIPNNGVMEVIHFGDLNIEVPGEDPELFIGTYYYRARGSGVGINVGSNTLVAWNKVHALKLMGVSDATIYEESGQSLRNIIDSVREQNPSMSFDEALSLIISEMVEGRSLRYDPSTRTYKYFGPGDSIDDFLAATAVEQGFTSIQLVREAQSPPGAPLPPTGYELIDLKRPTESSADLLTDLKIPLA